MYRDTEQPAKSVAEPRLLLTEKQAAERLGISRTALFNLRHSGKVGYVRIGPTGVRYTPDQLMAFVDSARKDAE